MDFEIRCGRKAVAKDVAEPDAGVANRKRIQAEGARAEFEINRLHMLNVTVPRQTVAPLPARFRDPQRHAAEDASPS